MGGDGGGEQTSRRAKRSSPQPDLTKNEFGSAEEGGLERGGSRCPGDHAVEQVGEAAITRREQKFPENTKKERLDVNPVLIPLGPVRDLPSCASKRSRRELEVGDIAPGLEMRVESSPVEKSTKRDENHVVVGVFAGLESILVVGLQVGAEAPDGSCVGVQGS